MQHARAGGRAAALVLVGVVGHLIVGLVWLRFGGGRRVYWRDEGLAPLTESTSPGAVWKAELGARKRTEVGYLGWPGRTDTVLVLGLAALGGARKETWAITRLAGDEAGAGWRFVWSGDERVALVNAGGERVSFIVGPVAAK